MTVLTRTVKAIQSLNPQANTNGTRNGTAVDLSGFEGCLAIFHVGAVTDGTHTPKLQESDDNSSFTDVAAGDLSAAFAVLATNTQQVVAYKGAKRYVRPVLTTAGATTGAIAGAIMVRGDAHAVPIP